ncbi:dephospho-CoA kinase [Portibacter lacus]|uniref:Dephospho-CoA kinase n=1 Tax=Portibacter lacus TaxID=1099794 RepID=A0AA37SLK1_9BACT|nr:dephospho-CoA kinase [Portibacter lacus]GLR15487.1 dephospho-CoA kinase [Portibacter lacus]
MKTIGLTGGMGSGKSYIGAIFKLMKIPIYDSDFHAKRLMIESEEVRNQIISLLGSEAYNADQTLNREFVASQIFNDNKKLTQINEIVHPAVRKDFSEFAAAHTDSSYVINEAALFVENGTYQDFDYLITVVAPMQTRLRRLKLRDKKPEKEILKRITQQSSDRDKILKSHFVIYNDELQDLFQQITAIHQAVGK